MPTKKKTKAAAKKAKEDAGLPDPREPLEPTPANLTATLKQLKAVLADIPEPEPIIEEPEPEEPEAEAATGSTEGEAADGDKPAESKRKKKEPIVRLPELDFVDALLHLYFAHGLPCGYGQEARRRIEESFVDRNEFRVTEAFEVEELMRDLDIPDLFDRCLAVRESIAQVYNDQNGVHMTFLREASISDRNMFFQRVPAVQPHVQAFLTNLLTLEEICFSEKSTLRAQQRLGLDPKNSAVSKWVDEVRALLKPYGHLPLSVGPHGKDGKPSARHELSPACLLARLAPAPKGKKR
ncbi:MAG: hypothetical protein ACE37K_05360 [Planctomycetota bacterium]